ncbi:MAG: D-Ala-D-Ala carboxypeptidase family metallohydrolase [Candidatus Margulisiibacteriota bacterium]
MKITEHFTWEELTCSDTAVRKGIDNNPGEQEKENIEWLCKKILEPVRFHKGPVIITSGYRSPKVNSLIGGSATSQHCFGQAADIVVPAMTIEELFQWIINDTQLPFDQCIQEYGRWVHLSYSRDRQRKQALRAVLEGGKTRYVVA